MQMMLFKWLLFLLAINPIEGLGKLWKFNDSPAELRIMKNILESCYENDSSSNPILIFGDFNEIIDKKSIIRINNFQNVDKRSSEELFQYKMSRIVLIEDSPAELKTNLILLKETKWWDHMAPFFIIPKNKKTCENFKNILLVTWEMDILNSIYICPETMNTTALYTLNPIANYAPYPWRKVETVDDLNIFRQLFNRTFLSTQERVPAFKTIDEVAKLGHTIYIPLGMSPSVQQGCPKCMFKEVRNKECIDYVLNGTHNVCVINEIVYESEYILLNLERVEKVVLEDLVQFKCRHNWPLRNRFSNTIRQLVESGIADFLALKKTIQPKLKRQAIEADWLSARYRPVRLIKLKFAFQTLAAGLTLAIIAFLLELLVAKCIRH